VLGAQLELEIHATVVGNVDLIGASLNGLQASVNG
jgi:hypothetical protein